MRRVLLRDSSGGDESREGDRGSRDIDLLAANVLHLERDQFRSCLGRRRKRLACNPS